MIVQIQQMTDDRGILINSQPVSLHVPPALQFTAAKILETEYTTTTATNSGGITNLNDINPLQRGKYFPRGYFTNNRFADTDAWFVKSDVPNGLIYFDRAPLATAMEGDFNTGNARFKARQRYSFGVGDWRQFMGSAGT